MSTYADMDFNFDADLDEAAFAEADRAFDAYMQEIGGFVPDDEQARYEEWCEDMELDSTEDHWESYYDHLIPDDED